MIHVREKPNCQVVIAGPGAGKTHNMVNEVLKALNTLNPNKFCCVITYTNSATDVIKKRLRKRISIPSNLFIGTIHSFLIQFIIEPYGHLFELCDIEKNYIEGVQITLSKYVGTIPQKAFCDIEGIDKAQSKEIWKELIQKKILNYNKGKAKISYRFKPEDEDFDLNLNTVQNLDNEITEVIKGKNIKSSTRHIIIVTQSRKINTDLAKKSTLTYDQILQLSQDLIINEKVKENILKRIEYLFVDEYQDLRIIQHNVLKELLYSPKIKSFVIGDPYQFIYNFSYYNSLLDENSPDFEDIPLMKMRNDNSEYNKINRRSSREIVEFINNFTQFKQDPELSDVFGINVSFINHSSVDTIKNQFEKLIENNQIKEEDDKIYKVLLAYSCKSDKIEKIITSFNSEETSNSYNNITIYNSWEIICLGAIGYKKKEFLNKNNLTIIEFRKICILLFNIITSKYHKYEDNNHLLNSIRSYIKNKWKLLVNGTYNQTNFDNSIANLFEIQRESRTDYLHSTIHKFKGMEATCVIIIATTINELKTFIETDLNIIKENEKCRIGYVAFSRARKLLCIACLEEIDEETKKKLIELNVKFSDEILS